MAVDTLSRQALLEAKQEGGYAPRVKVWPPEGYVPPTAEEFDTLRQAARRYAGVVFHLTYWKKVTDDQVLRRYQLAEVDGPEERAVYAYTRALRDELRRRGLVHRSIALLRCEQCSHATERLFEVTQETHPGLKSPRGPVTSAWYCARCWSGDDVADEDELEDEG
ncbi:hypothetical protein [Streptomyces sp. NRRL S-455]|uniref:hypothetical protein n=1 Tax=Streptomyces sp. NRRL S-455 TaxID=1463908 RepID=UPI0004C1B63D|nr:hypothetical protein [Streptomyces sp. NRRL S-455]